MIAVLHDGPPGQGQDGLRKTAEWRHLPSYKWRATERKEAIGTICACLFIAFAHSAGSGEAASRRAQPFRKGTIMLLSSTTTVPGIFEKHEQAVKAIAALKQAGFRDDQIAIGSRELARKLERVPVEEQHITEKGAIRGALIGGGVGAALGLAGAIFIPGVLPLVAGSALVGAVGGGLAGSAVGAFTGPFFALGWSEDELRRHARHVEEGKTVLLVYAPGQEAEARSIMVEHGAFDESMNAE
jgi:hypothetical protein